MPGRYDWVRVFKTCVLLRIAPRSTLIICIRNSQPRFKKGIAQNVGSEQGQIRIHWWLVGTECEKYRDVPVPGRIFKDF